MPYWSPQIGFTDTPPAPEAPANRGTVVAPLPPAAPVDRTPTPKEETEAEIARCRRALAEFEAEAKALPPPAPAPVDSVLKVRVPNSREKYPILRNTGADAYMPAIPYVVAPTSTDPVLLAATWPSETAGTVRTRFRPYYVRNAIQALEQQITELEGEL